MMRRLATTALTATLLSGGGLAITATPAAATAPSSAAVADDNYSLVGAFGERYRGRYIYGWGGTRPCAFIDGVSLELIDHGQNWYSSAVNAYEKTFGVRATTRAAVRSLAGADLQPTEPPAYCRF